MVSKWDQNFNLKVFLVWRNGSHFIYTVKITTVLGSKPTKSVGHFEGNRFSVGCHKFLVDYCPKLIKTYNFGQNAVNKRQLKSNIVQLGYLFSKLQRLFVNFSSAIISIFTVYGTLVSKSEFYSRLSE